MTIDCAFDLDDISGRFEVAERGEQDEDGLWTSTQLVGCSIDDGSLSVIFRDNGVRVSVSAHHIENKKTHRAFHAVLDWKLSWREVANLHDFLGLLLKWENKE